MELEQNQLQQFDMTVEQLQVTDPVLSELRRPKDIDFGKHDFHELYADTKKTLLRKNKAGLILGGLPAGGKTRITEGLINELTTDSDISSWAIETNKTNEEQWLIDSRNYSGEPLQKKPSEALKIRSLVWADFFYLAQDTGTIGKTMIDPVSGEVTEKTIDHISSDDAVLLTDMMATTAERIIDRHERIHSNQLTKDYLVTTSDVDPTPVPALVITQEAPLLPNSKRGFKAAKILLERTDANVIYNTGDKHMQKDMGESGLRGEVQHATTDTIMDILHKFNIDPKDVDPERVLKKWKRSGATPGAIRKINKMITTQLFDMFQKGELEFPKYRMNKKEENNPPFPITSPEDLEKNMDYRARLIARNIFPRGAAELGVSDEHVLYVINKKQESVHDEKLGRHNLAKRLLGFREAATSPTHLFYSEK